MGFTIDARDFEKGMKELVEKSIPRDIDRGLFASGNALLRDGIYERPFAPFDEGHLRGAARVQGSGGVGVGLDQLATNPQAEEVAGGRQITAGFNIVYAGRWHELSPEEDRRINWSLPGSGRKYLEIKMIRNATRYLAIMGEFLKQRLGGK